jgi:hypothetical protein
MVGRSSRAAGGPSRINAHKKCPHHAVGWSRHGASRARGGGGTAAAPSFPRVSVRRRRTGALHSGRPTAGTSELIGMVRKRRRALEPQRVACADWLRVVVKEDDDVMLALLARSHKTSTPSGYNVSRLFSKVPASPLSPESVITRSSGSTAADGRGRCFGHGSSGMTLRPVRLECGRLLDVTDSGAAMAFRGANQLGRRNL